MEATWPTASRSLYLLDMITQQGAGRFRTVAVAASLALAALFTMTVPADTASPTLRR